MDDQVEKDTPKIQADNQSIAIGEINISGTVTGNITIGHTIVQPADARLRHELGILLKNVQTTWIQGVLERSVHEAALLELGLELREEAVDNPWRMVIEGPDQTQQTLPRGRKIKDIFDEANRLLLILGEPGSGKTTTLLQLARDLIVEVDDAFTQPVPVILNLSTWTNKAQPLDEWLVAELNSKYRLPKKDGQRWLKERRILPLLDGLDEVRAENRAACVEKINQLVVDYGLQGMVVCSRIKDYTALDVRLAFYRAIYIQPLSPEQVDEYLNRAGEKLTSLRATLQADLALRSMAQSPLILNIMSLAYQNASAESLSNPSLNTEKARRKHLLDTYISRMFIRKVGVQQYDDEQTKQRLSWMARNMQRHSQEVFLIEGLQPSWLPTRRLQWMYFLTSRLVGGWSIAFGFISFFELIKLSNVIPNASSDVVIIIVLSFLGVIAGISVGYLDVLRFEWLRKRIGRKKLPSFWWLTVNFVATLLISGLISGTVMSLLGGLLEGLIGGLIVGLIYGTLLGLRGNRQSPDIDIETVETLSWSWRKAARGGVIGVVGGLLFGLINVLTSGFADGLATGAMLVMFFAPVGVLLSGLHRGVIETKSVPNQGISLSIKNAIFRGLFFGLTVGSLLGLLFGWMSRIGGGILSISIYLMLTGILFGLIGILWYGGLDVIQHYTLRLILLIQGHTPANYARFLDYAVNRIFLQKVGGGYRFIHRLLLEHFAEMSDTKKSVIANGT